MQTIYPYNYNLCSYNKPIAFKGFSNNIIPESKNIISHKSKLFIDSMNYLIETTWTDIKAGKSMRQTPKFWAKDKNGEELMVTPIYGMDRPSMLLELFSGKYTDRFIIDRKLPDNFKFERSVYTDFGSAIIKSFDSRVSSDNEIEELVNQKICTFFPTIIPKKILRECFGKFYYKYIKKAQD